MKKILFLLAIIVIPCVSFCAGFTPPLLAYAEEETIETIIDEQLEILDTQDLQKVLDGLDDQSKKIFGGDSFLDKLKLVISGNLGADTSSVLQYVVNLLFDNLLTCFPLMSIIISIAILGSMIQGLKPKSNGESISNIVNFVIYGVILALIFSVLGKLVVSVGTSISVMKSQMDVVFPILLTLLTSIGGTVSVGVYQPAMAVLSSVIINIFTAFLLPLFILSIVLVFVNSLSPTIKLNKMIDFLGSLFKWAVGIIFTVFLGFASMQGLTAGSIDGFSIKTAKYTMKNYIPFVGGYMSDGVFLMLAGCNLIKNAVGICGLLLMVSSILAPLIEIIVFMLALKFTSAMIEPLGNAKLAGLISGIAKSMKMLIAMVVTITFMYVLLVGLVMCSANIV